MVSKPVDGQCVPEKLSYWLTVFQGGAYTTFLAELGRSLIHILPTRLTVLLDLERAEKATARHFQFNDPR